MKTDRPAPPRRSRTAGRPDPARGRLTDTNVPADHYGSSRVLDVLVVGAGQSGLALGRHLQRAGARFLLIDEAPQIGHSWRSRWDSLRLFTPAEYDGLPDMPFPAAAGTYPSKDDVADYLAAYATRFQLPVLLGTALRRLTRSDGLFRAGTSSGTLTARQVVIATGAFTHPAIPEVSGLFADRVVQVHSSEYANPAALPAGHVLVVGGGNSGLQIAAELAATRRVTVAVGSPSPELPQRFLGRDLFWWLTRLGLLTKPATSRLARRMRARGDLVIGSRRKDLEASGVRFTPRLLAAHGSWAVFADDTTTAVDAVVWATGFRPDHRFVDIEGAVDGSGCLVHERGVSPVEGLHVLGLPWQHSRGSALLGFVQHDAAWLALRLTTRSTYAPEHAAADPGDFAGATPVPLPTR